MGAANAMVASICARDMARVRFSLFLSKYVPPVALPASILTTFFRFKNSENLYTN